MSMPSFAENAVAKLTSRLPRGKIGTAFAMGAASALIAGPCVAPPLAGALTYIGQTRDATLGGLALFSLAWGMSAPMVAFGAGLGALLPKSGRWSTAIQKLFGIALIGLSAYFAYPLASRALFHDAPAPSSASTAIGSHGAPITENNFRTVKTLAEFDAALASSKKPVLFDIHAAWCVACEEIHKKTFPDPGVQAFLASHELIALDATDMDEQTQAIMKRFSVFGPPALFVFPGSSPSGAKPSASLMGYAEPTKFLASLRSP
jgi:thiol:disulfide interchange protein DsbD